MCQRTSESLRLLPQVLGHMTASAAFTTQHMCAILVALLLLRRAACASLPLQLERNTLFAGTLSASLTQRAVLADAELDDWLADSAGFFRVAVSGGAVTLVTYNGTRVALADVGAAPVVHAAALGTPAALVSYTDTRPRVALVTPAGVHAVEAPAPAHASLAVSGSALVAVFGDAASTLLVLDGALRTKRLPCAAELTPRGLVCAADALLVEYASDLFRGDATLAECSARHVLREPSDADVRALRGVADRLTQEIAPSEPVPRSDVTVTGLDVAVADVRCTEAVVSSEWRRYSALCADADGHSALLQLVVSSSYSYRSGRLQMALSSRPRVKAAVTAGSLGSVVLACD